MEYLLETDDMKQFNIISETVDSIINELYNGSNHSLVAKIEEALFDNNPDILYEVNRVLSVPANLNFLCYKIINDYKFYSTVLKSSYYHENGFDKIVLLSGKNFKLRLHHFGNGLKIPMENVHDHRWMFASTILFGDLQMDMFHASIIHDSLYEAEILNHFVYDSNKTSGSYEVTYRGKAALKLLETRKYEFGQSYIMWPHELHRIKNSNQEESITLILTGNPISEKCNLYSTREFLEEEKAPKYYNDRILRKKIVNILEKIYPQKN